MSLRDGSEGSSPELEILRRELQVLGERIEQATVRPAEQGIARHLRRFAPFYALLLVWALLLGFFPSKTADRSQTAASARQAGAGQSLQQSGANGYEQTGAVATTDGTTPGAQVSAVGAGGVQAAKAAAKGAPPQAVAGVQVGSGLTRGGFDCKVGVRQMPWSQYADRCVAKFTGNNGGATSRGVTATEIKLVTRVFPDTANSQAVSAFAQAAGAASSDVSKQVRDTFREYFNKVFELYGRKVVFEEFTANSQANGTDEAQGKNKEGACIDATKVANELKAFAVTGSSAPFGECLAERQVVSFNSGAYYPETWYRKYHPYLYGGPMECERIVYQNAEYVGKRLAGRKAKWAGDPLIQQQDRKFAIYVPTNDGYQLCADIFERELKTKYNTAITSRYNYTLDVSRFPDEAARGMVQFKAAGATTIAQACDPISTTVETQAATAQNYYPEWYLFGVAVQDTDSVARLYDQKQADGHMFGMSQLGDQSKLWGPNSEPGITYKKITGKDIPAGTEGGYFTTLTYFNIIQAAGPILTSQTLERGAHQVLAGGFPDFAVGYTSMQDGPDGTLGATDHTWIDDSREIYWCGKCASKVDGKEGAYLETYGGKRFRNNEWSREEPPIYPKK